MLFISHFVFLAVALNQVKVHTQCVNKLSDSQCIPEMEDSVIISLEKLYVSTSAQFVKLLQLVNVKYMSFLYQHAVQFLKPGW